MLPRLITIGVYGFEQERFFQALQDAHIDIFFDLRQRRAMRGSTYAFANSQRLQGKLNELGMRYVHAKELAPDRALREVQHLEDKELMMTKRTRNTLGQRFVQAYEQAYLATFDPRRFIECFAQEANVIALFCVEREPEACHRSLVAQRIALELGCAVEHIKP